MNNQNATKCPRCQEGRMLSWHELTEEEREVARRLPGTADYSPAKPEAIRRWCTRCWYEAESKALDA